MTTVYRAIAVLAFTVVAVICAKEIAEQVLTVPAQQQHRPEGLAMRDTISVKEK